VGNGGEDGWFWKIVLVHCVGPLTFPKGQLILPTEIRLRDNIEPGQEFEIERIDHASIAYCPESRLQLSITELHDNLRSSVVPAQAGTQRLPLEGATGSPPPRGRRSFGCLTSRNCVELNNEGLVDWLLACPKKNYFVPIESEPTDAL
jgi:hypothetical protein